VANQQSSEVVRNRRQQCGRTPDQRTHHDDRLSREAHRQRPHERSGAHVKNEKYAGQNAESAIAAVKFSFDQILHREEHRPINVVE
jgi:hypothetical protein